MKLLGTLDVNASPLRRIELFVGDLSKLSDEHAVDILIISAFKEDYLPTQSSLIGALYRSGVSVMGLSQDKQIDLRQQFSCWLSKPLQTAAFKHVLCIESGWRGSPPEITDDLFRALAPCLLSDLPNSTVAMPVLGSGDQGFDFDVMLKTILEKAASWMRRGLPLNVLKIVVFSDTDVDSAQKAFAAFKSGQGRARAVGAAVKSHSTALSGYDVFLSYSRKQSDIASMVAESLRKAQLNVFFDQANLREGVSWAWELAMALDASRKVIALYSESYWESKNCQSEFLAALSRQTDQALDILFPIYILDANIPYMFRNIQYADCRLSDLDKISAACNRLISIM